MTDTRDLIVRVIGDDRSVQKMFTRQERSVKQFESRTAKVGTNLRTAFAAAGIALGTQQLFASIEESIEAASDLNEQISKSRQVFGTSSAAIEEWSKTTARSFGISQRAALQATGTFGNLFHTVGLVPDVASEMSRSLVELAADLASFNNASPEDVLVAIRSGLIGEAEPLRRYGVLLSEARVQQEAMAATGKKNVKSLTDQEKALARYRIILRDTATAQGDFARTADGLANQSRTLRANLDDLSASVGSLLIPALTDLARTANLAAEALARIGRVEIPGAGQISGLLGWISGWKELDFLLDQIEGKMERIGPGMVTGPQRARPTGGFRADAEARAAVREAQRQQRELERSRRTFNELTKGLGLKLDKAEITAMLDDDLAVLREIERSILRQISREGRTFKLVQALTDVRGQIADITQRRAANAAEKSRNAFDAVVDSLSLKLELARMTTSFADDQRILRQIEQAILERIQREGRTTELLRQLFDVRQQQADIRRQLAEQQQRQRKTRQFKALGLTEEGQEPVPGVGALRRRASTLKEQIKGTFLDTSKTRSQLQRIAKVLSGEFGKVGRDVRAAILRMLNDITRALEGGSGKKGPLTKFRVANFSNIADQFPSLSQDDARKLQQILSRIGPGGTTPRSTTTGGAFGFEVSGGGNVIINGPITVVANDAAEFMRSLEKRKRRNAGSRTGPRARQKN